MTGVAGVAGADRDDLGAKLLELFVPVAQLRGVLTAQQSAEVAQKDQHARNVLPEITQTTGGCAAVRRCFEQLDGAEVRDLHGSSLRQSQPNGDVG